MALHRVEVIELATVVNHSLNSGGGSAHVEVWQVINLAGSIVLAGMFLPPVVEDFIQWRRDRADRD